MDTFASPEVIKLAGAIITVLTYYLRSAREFPSIGRRKTKEHESLEFISSFLAFDVSRRHRVVVEHAFEIYLRRRLAFEEINALLRLANPLRAAKMYTKAGQHVSFNAELSQFEYQPSVATKRRRSLTHALNLGGYFFFSMAGVLLFMFAPELIGDARPLAYLPLGLVVLMLLFLSYLFLDDVTSLSVADRFLKEAQKISA